jgi:cell shape-determining protein MreC
VRAFFVDAISPLTPGRYESLSRNEMIVRLAGAEQELDRIRYQGVLYELLLAENAELKRAVAPASGFASIVPARVIARPPRTHYDTLVLDAGAEAGIRENDVVAVSGIALGRIASVDSRSSLAQLFSSPQLEHDVVLGEPQAVAIATGLGGGAFEVELPQEVQVNPGDAVRIPRSETLVLGIVVEIEGEATDATKTVRFRSPASVYALDYVSVLLQDTEGGAETPW